VEILIAICLLAALAGSLAPHCWKTRPAMAVALATLLPPAALYVRYQTFARVRDWEGMGALALIIVAFLWIMISFAAGMISFRSTKKRRRK
jgi:hypothetical protein